MRRMRRAGWETRVDWSEEGLCWVVVQIVVQALVLVSGTFGGVAVPGRDAGGDRNSLWH